MLKPLGEFLIVRRDEVEKKTEGGLFIPDGAQEPPRSGVVLAIGPGVRATETGLLLETTLKPGDRVLFGPFGGVEIGLMVDKQEEKLLMLKESEVFGTYPPEKKARARARKAS
jgi:chaperonin GroES